MTATASRRLLPLLLGSALLLAACSQDTGVEADAAGDARIRVVNVATGTAQLSFSVEGGPGGELAALIATGNASGYVTIPAGDRVVHITPATSGAAVQTVVHAEAGKSYSVLAVTRDGLLATDTKPDTGAVVPAGMTKVRVIHEAKNAPALDIWRTQPDFTTGIRVMFPFAFGAASPYLQSTAGAWSVYVTLEGSTTPIATTGSFDVPAGERRTVIVIDNPAGGVMLKIIPD